MKTQFNLFGSTSKNIKLIGLIGLGVLLSLACSSSSVTQYLPSTPNLSQYLPATATFTPTPTVPAIEVTIIYVGNKTGPADDAQSAQVSTPISLHSVTGTPAPLVLVTDTPQPTATPIPIPAQPAAPPLITGTTIISFTQPITGSTIPDSAVSVPANATPSMAPDGSITVVELADNLDLPEDVAKVEFKWVWNSGGVCDPVPEDQGFSVTIWPDLPGQTPLGVADIAASQELIVCDPKSNTRTLEVGNIRNTPGVQAAGSGQFRWQISLVELAEPFTPKAVSASRAFRIPADPTTPTPTITPIPRVTVQCPCGVDGEIVLIEMQDGVSVPPADETIEMKWRWTAAPGCEAPPPGYGFEVRIWPDRPDYGPMGAMGNAVDNQGSIGCDPANGTRNYVVQKYQTQPGVIVAGAGRFRWDVILFQADPYKEVILSPSRVFILPGESKLDK